MLVIRYFPPCHSRLSSNEYEPQWGGVGVYGEDSPRIAVGRIGPLPFRRRRAPVVFAIALCKGALPFFETEKSAA
jgi:hypothetical protein